MIKTLNFLALFLYSYACCLPLCAATEEPIVESVAFFVGSPGVKTEFLLSHWNRQKCVYRSVQSSTSSRLQLSKFRSCETGSDEKSLLSQFQHFTEVLKEEPFDSVSYYSRLSIALEICYSHGQVKKFKRIYFPQVDPSFLIRSKWKKADRKSIDTQKSVIGSKAYQLLAEVLDYDSEKSKPWFPEKCLLHISNLEPGVSDGMNWKGYTWNKKIEFDEAVRPLSASMIIDYDENLSQAPFGVINTGQFNGFYEITLLPFDEERNAEKVSGSEN